MNSEERRQELERKKQKLAEIKEQRRQQDEERRRSLMAQGLQQNGNGPTTGRATLSTAQLAEILADVGIPAEPNSSSETKSASSSHSMENGVAQHPRAQTVTSSSRVVNLELTAPKSIVVPQKDSTIYCKTTQTDDEKVTACEFSMGSQELAWESDNDDAHPQKRYVDEMDYPLQRLDSTGSPTDEVQRILSGFNFMRHTSHEGDKREAEEEKQKVPDYSEEEKQQIMQTLAFQAFFDKTSKILERALAEEVNIFADYSSDEKIRFESTEDRLTFRRSFTDPKWTKGREVMAITFSERHPELFGVGYETNLDKPGDPAGIVAVFNTKFKKDSPEFLFHTPARITSVTFARFHTNLILAGCYTGQICMWDNRVLNKKTPINRSPLSTKTHTQPIFALQVVGSHNAHNLVSISSDGRMCTWNVDNLAQTVDTKNLMVKGGSKPIPVVCMAFPINEFNNFVVGAEDGHIYQVTRHGATTTDQAEQIFEGHSAPISSISFHRAASNVHHDFSHMFLSSSCDWSVKLWSLKDPLLRYSFETHSEYVYDAQWSPVHPGLFATIDADGTLCLWNLNEDIEEPISRITIETENMAAQGRKLAFSPNGQYIVTGDNLGNINLFELHESFHTNVRNEEWNKLARVLADMKASREEADELSEAMKLGSASTISAQPSLATASSSSRLNWERT